MTVCTPPSVAIRNRAHAALITAFALAAALAVCVVMLFWTPLEAPASWRAASHPASTAGRT